jgi:type VI secretion system protein
MAVDRSILERLARPRQGAGRSLAPNPREVTRSVLRNLQNLLNTRLGSAPAQMDLGMPAPSDIAQASPDAISLVMRNLRACIEKYEPRLASVEIAHIESGDEVLTLRFQISARLGGSTEGAAISFDTVVDPAGRIRLQA